MDRQSQDLLGRCSFIDVLEEAVLRRRPVRVELRGGAAFIDRLVDVQTEGGEDYAVFGARPRVAVGSIAAVGPADAAD